MKKTVLQQNNEKSLEHNLSSEPVCQQNGEDN